MPDQFKLGDRVQTIKILYSRDYNQETQITRQPDQIGTVVKISDAHGRCYKVHHDDESYSYYDADELILLNK